MRLTLPEYGEGDRIPRSDFAARAKHGKDSNGACMIVGCGNNAVECEKHGLYRVASANDAYSRSKDKALAYCWGRADAGDATAHPQEVWWAFSEWYARASFSFTLEKRGSMPSIQRSWELFVEDKDV